MNIISYTKLVKSIQCAFVGLQTAFREEQNFRLECLCAVLVVLLGWFFHLSTVECAIIVTMVGLVLGLELVNTAVEHLAGMVDMSHNSSIKAIKDMSAAGVLIACIAALAVGGIIFIPHFIRFF